MKIILPWARSIVLGWVMLLAIAYGVERPVLHRTAPLFGPIWIATAHLAFDCLTLAAAGFVAGRAYRSHAVPAAAMFAVTLCFWDFGNLLGVNIPWLVQLVWNSFHDAWFVDSLVTSLETQVILFGCLFAGGMLGRGREKPMSIVD